MKYKSATGNSQNHFFTLLVTATLALLSACSSSDSTPITETPGGNTSTQYAYIATAGVDSGAIDRYSVESNTLVSSYPTASTTDLEVASDGTNVYQIAKRGTDTITKFDAIDTSAALFQFFVNGDEMLSNPSSLAFVNETKAYVTRYGSDKVWIIDPSVGATDEASFKTGELDISVYANGEGALPRVTQSVIVDNKLFLLLERLDASFAPTDVGYVAVFDTTTDEEINTGKGENGLLGIKLNTLNPSTIQYLAASNEIYVTGRGNPFNEFNDVEGDPYQGGIETIDPSNYDIELLLDDGTESNNNGYFLKALVVSPTQGYIVTNASTFRVDTLRSFNPMTGVLAAEPVAGFTDTAISDIALAPDGKLWVGVPGAIPGDGSGYFQLDVSSNTIVGELMATSRSPLNVVFIDVPAE